MGLLKGGEWSGVKKRGNVHTISARQTWVQEGANADRRGRGRFPGRRHFQERE